MIYANFVKKLINHMFGDEHSVITTEVLETNNAKKKQICVYIITNEEYFGKIIGKKGKIINILNGLLKIKSYLKNCHTVLKVEK